MATYFKGVKFSWPVNFILYVFVILYSVHAKCLLSHTALLQQCNADLKRFHSAFERLLVDIPCQSYQLLQSVSVL
jgi:hypothetical protein